MSSLKRVAVGDGNVVVTLGFHDAAVGGVRVPCWTAVTEGLAAVGQREVAVTIVRWSDNLDDYPHGVLGYLGALRDLAVQGRFVGVGGFSGYRPPGPFGLGSFVGVAFGPAQPIAGLPIGDQTLTGVLLTEAELAMASVAGALRVLTKLGAASRYFPFPYWSDHRRPPVYAPGDSDHTILTRMPTLTCNDASATLSGRNVHLLLGAADAGRVAQQLESGQVAGLLLGRDPAAQAILTWAPGQSEPAAITADNVAATAIAACFVGLVPSQERADAVLFQEDGFNVLLSDRSLAALIATLHRGGSTQMSSADGHYDMTVTVVGH